MITIKDIAKEAGVSPTTVSRVINHVPNKVSDEKRKQIQALIEKYDFIPNPSARSLIVNESRIIAILQREPDSLFHSRMRLYMLKELVGLIQEKGYLPAVYNIDGSNSMDMLKKFNVDGAILLGDFDSMAEELTMQDYPVVFTDSYSSLRLCSNVGVDDYKAGMLAAEYMLGKKCCRFIFLENEAYSAAQQDRQLEGFCDVISRTYDLSCISRLSLEGLRQSTESLDAETGVFAHSINDAFICTTGICPASMLICFDAADSGAAIPFPMIMQDMAKKAAATTDIMWKQIHQSSGVMQRLIMDVTVEGG